jgi:8-oxo-dGTP diphosphatase
MTQEKKVEERKDRFRCYVAAALLLVQEGQILLMKRANTGFGDGLYGLPGGSLDGNEPIKSALAREAQEELGIHIEIDALELASCLHVAPHFRTPNEVLLFGFTVKKFTGVLQNKEPHKCDEIRFFPLTQLPDTILEGSRKLIENMQSHTNFSELHW